MIGASCGVVGAVFVKLNKRWMSFRKAHGTHLLLRNRFAWSTVFIFFFGLVSFPESPVGHFMSKGQVGPAATRPTIRYMRYMRYVRYIHYMHHMRHIRHMRHMRLCVIYVTSGWRVQPASPMGRHG